MKKRVLSLFMALALCLTMLPTAALAEEAGVVQDAANANSTYTTGENAGLTGGKDGSVPDGTDGGDADSSGEAQDGEADAAAEAGTHTAHCVCGKDSTTVNGHTHSTNTAWKAANSLPNSAGSYYLTQSVSGGWTVPEGEVNLCLNGQTIDGSIKVGSGATLTLTDCSGNGKVQGEVTVNGGKFELYSGTITGGVQVGIKGGTYQTGSSFTMYGGAITGNEDYGGVFLVGTTNHTDPPSFTMHGGTISNNTAGASDGGGGGVYVGEKCSFTMDGGTITGNTATAGNGGGIYIHFNAGIVSISNATITGNKASATGNTSYGHGGGIYSERGVTVKNVTITGNNSTYEGGGIYGKGAITLTDATVTDNNHYDVYYDGTESTNPKLTVSGSVKAGYYANYDWKLPILVSGALSEDSVIRVGVREGINPGAIAEPASGVTLRAENFKADAADSVTSLGNDGKVYLVPCTHEMDDTGYTCKKCHTQFDARVGDSAYYQTLTKAFDAARDSTVTLLRDVTLTGNCSSDTYPATLDLNGKTVSSGRYYIHVGGGNKPNTLTVKDSSKGGGTQALNVKFWVASNGTLAVDDSYTGEISRVELQAGGALERFGGKIGELVLSNAAYGSTSTGYGLKLWKGNPNACTIGKITDNTKSKSLTVNDLLGTDYAKCELYGEKDSVWSIVPKTEKISELTGYTAYKVQFTECVHQCANDSNPVCSVCHKDLYTKITAKAADGTTKTAYFTEDSALENGYVEAIQTLNGWSNEGCTEPTLTLLRDMYAFGTSMPLTGTLTLKGGTHTAKNVTVAKNADVTFASGSYRGATINGTATVKEDVTFTSTVTVNGTLNAKGGTFDGPVEFNGSSTANISGGSFTNDKLHGGVAFNYNVTGTISGGTFVFADFYTTKVKLSGGTFTTIKTNSDRKLADLLAEGAAYYSGDSAVSEDKVSSLTNVTVKSHEHNGGKDGNGTCSICGKQMAASLTVGGTTSWYAAFATAIEAANAADGEKTITLYQDVDGTVNGKRTTYELTRGPVTLATGGKTVEGVDLVAKGISLTVTGSNGGFYVTVDGKDAKLTVNDKDTKLAIVTAKNGGKLSLSNGTFSRVAVKDDGSSASLSGGSYGEITSDAGYVKPYALLAKGYAYKKTTDNKWLPNANSIPSKVTVEKAPFAVEKIYPNSDEGYTGNSAFATDGSITLTAVIAPETEGVTYYYWWELFNESKNDWTTKFSNVNTATHNGGRSKTLSISNLPENSSYQYHVYVSSDNGYNCYSEPFTVTRHQHSWTYTASGATITAKCSKCSASGGSVTIAAPAELTYSGEGKPATVTVSSDWQGPAVSDISIGYIKTGKYGSEQLENSARPTNAGKYTASITLGEGENAKTASVEYTIKKAIPMAGDFTFQPLAPSDLTYNGNPKTAAVTPSEDKNGMGEVTVKYYQDDKLVEKPTNAGDYTVKISVADGTNYEAVVDNLTDPDWKFTITKADPTPPTGLTGVTGKRLSTVTLTTGWSWKNGDAVLSTTGDHTFEASYVGDNNHNSITTNLTVAVSNKSVDKNTLSLTQASMTYGQGELRAYELTNKPENAGEDRVHYTGTLRNGNSYDSSEKPTQAGSYTVTVTCETADTIYTASANFTIYPIDLGDGSHGVGFSSPEITYTGNAETASVHPLGPNGSPQMKLNTDYEISGTISATNVGKYTATIQGIGNNYTGEVSGTWQITPAPLTITGATAKERGYEKNKTDVEITSVTFNGVVPSGTTLQGTDYDATGKMADDTAGDDKPVNVTVELKGDAARNYTLAKKTAETTVKISKAAYSGTKITNGIAKFGTEGTVDLSSLIAEGGTAAFDRKTDTNSVLEGNPTVEGNTLKFKFADDAQKANKTATVDVKVTGAKNYGDYFIIVTLKVTEKKAQTPLKYTGPSTVTYGKTVPLTFTGGSGNGKMTYEIIPVGGRGMVDEEKHLFTATLTGEATIKVSKAGDDTYEATPPVAVKINVTKAPLTVKVSDQQIYVGGTAPDLTKPQKGTHYTVTGLVNEGDLKGKAVMKYQQNGSDVTPDTSMPGVYDITFTGLSTATQIGQNTPHDNYDLEIVPGKLTILARPGGGSSSSGGGGGSDRDNSGSTGKTETTTKPDGTTVKTETKADGTKIQTETKKDGSTVKTTTNPNGSSVTETKAADGSTATVKTDKNGQTTAETTFSSKAIETAKRNGEPVTAPVEVKATRNSSTAPTVKIELPRNSGETKVEIPVTNVKPGTVAVLVHPDGTEEIVKNSLPTEDGIQLTVNGGATVKIVDNSKDFIDTRNHWAKDAIDFVSARGLVNGMSATIYAPNASTTRAQLWTILARQNNADLTGGATWFENAQNWAKEKGISDGTNPNGTINRAQMVTMLWRAMGQPAAASSASFADVPADSYYAQAVAWAIEKGITAGVGGGRFDPNSTCTRAQIVTFLYRSYQSK